MRRRETQGDRLHDPILLLGDNVVRQSDSQIKTLAQSTMPKVTIAFVGGSDTESATRKDAPKGEVSIATQRDAGDSFPSWRLDDRTHSLTPTTSARPLIQKYHYRAISGSQKVPNGIGTVGIAWAVTRGTRRSSQN